MCAVRLTRALNTEHKGILKIPVNGDKTHFLKPLVVTARMQLYMKRRSGYYKEPAFI